MSAARLKAVTLAPDPAIAGEARSRAAFQTHNLLMDAADALKALAKGDDAAADASLKLVLVACANARDALKPAFLLPSPVIGLEEWTS